MCDRKGVIYKGRDKLDQWKSKHAINKKLRTLEEAIKGADVFLGLSAKDALTKDMVKSMEKILLFLHVQIQIQKLLLKKSRR